MPGFDNFLEEQLLDVDEWDNEFAKPEVEIADELCTLAGNPLFCKTVTAMIKVKDQVYNPKKSLKDSSSMSTRKYLEEYLVPILVHGMAHIARERPPYPISALAAFLLRHKSDYEVPEIDGSETSQLSTP